MRRLIIFLIGVAVLYSLLSTFNGADGKQFIVPTDRPTPCPGACPTPAPYRVHLPVIRKDGTPTPTRDPRTTTDRPTPFVPTGTIMSQVNTDTPTPTPTSPGNIRQDILQTWVAAMTGTAQATP
jgi:hypothetical protein